jgi:hypothetical protein
MLISILIFASEEYKMEVLFAILGGAIVFLLTKLRSDKKLKDLEKQDDDLAKEQATIREVKERLKKEADELYVENKAFTSKELEDFWRKKK